MSTKITGHYLGDLKCEIEHGPSGAKISTDAPIDNEGEGRLFSPTDLMGAALAACTLTVMGIVARREGVKLDGASVVVMKEMADSPRRIARLAAKISMPPGIPKEKRKRVEAGALHCPVHKSLRSDIEAPIEFVYPD